MSCFLVRGQSMLPYLRDGDLVLTRLRRGRPQAGDVVVYRREKPPYLVVHRVVEADPEGLVAQGDANTGHDPERVSTSRVLGHVWCVLPRIGRLLSLLQRTRLS